jgi:hypothetical protein
MKEPLGKGASKVISIGQKMHLRMSFPQKRFKTNALR